MKTALEETLSNLNKDGMIAFLQSNPLVINEAIQLAITDKQPYSWRAAWLLKNYIENDDQRIQKFVNEIITAIDSKKDGHQRDLINILLLMNLDEEQESDLFNVCVNIWESIHKIPSVRYTAFKFISETGNKYPDLLNEISFYLQDHYIETLSPGIRNSLMKMIKKKKRKRK